MGMYHLSYTFNYICITYFIMKYSTCSFHVLLNMRYVSTQDVNFMALFFYVCWNTFIFGGFYFAAKMAGIENTSNYCFLSSLLHCVMNCNDIRNFLLDHYRRNTGLLNHNSKFFGYQFWMFTTMNHCIFCTYNHVEYFWFFAKVYDMFTHAVKVQCIL